MLCPSSVIGLTTVYTTSG
uniref:Uncharacterized protein n=1 Tax=Arundo donax TaxID=35708 RepID=A0A0A9BJL0_ARUDO